MQQYDHNDGHDDPVFLDHLVKRKGWSHQVQPHMIFATKEEALKDMIILYLQAVDYMKENATFELEMLKDLYNADTTKKLGVSIDQHTRDSMKIILDTYPDPRRALTCISPPVTKNSEKPSN